MTEGKTDVVYLKSTLNNLQNYYPCLVNKKTNEIDYSPKLNFPRLERKAKFLLNLGDGATSYLKLCLRYIKELEYFGTKKAKNPVILILDNDAGPKDLFNNLASDKKSGSKSVEDIRSQGFTYLFANLYLILTPLNEKANTEIEDLFDQETLNTTIDFAHKIASAGLKKLGNTASSAFRELSSSSSQEPKYTSLLYGNDPPMLSITDKPKLLPIVFNPVIDLTGDEAMPQGKTGTKNKMLAISIRRNTSY